MAKQKKLIKGNVKNVVMIHKQHGEKKILNSICGTIKINTDGAIVFNSHEGDTTITFLNYNSEE